MPRPIHLRGTLKRVPRLVGEFGPGGVGEVQLETRTQVGRSSANDIRLEAADASKIHYSIRREGGAFVLTDAGSQNGTFVNGRKVDEVTLAHRRRRLVRVQPRRGL